MARLLSVLDINDREDSSLQPNPLYHDTRTIRDAYGVQEELLTSDPQPVDIFLIDVNMDTNDHPGGLNWGDFPRYGPILALPFTFRARRPVTFAPYSSYWAHDAVRTDGALVVALSLLMSATDRKKVELADVQKHLGTLDPKSPILTEPLAALHSAVRKLRDCITNDDNLRLRDIVATRAKLQGLKPAGRGPKLDALLGAELTVGMYLRHEPNWTAKDILLHSLFMDVLDFGGTWNSAAFDAIDETLATWERKSEDFTVVQSAIVFLERAGRAAVLQEQPRNEGDVPNAPMAWNTVDPETQRLIILFAWIAAYARGEPELHSVCRTLGLPDDAQGAAYRKACCSARLPEVRAETVDVGLDQRDWDFCRYDQRDWDFCRYYARTVDPAGHHPRPPWMVDPDGPRGDRAWDRLMEMEPLFLDEDSGCVCNTRKTHTIRTRCYRKAHLGVCNSCCTEDDAIKEENLRLAHLYCVGVGPQKQDDWGDTERWKRDALRKCLRASHSTVFECIKMSVHREYCSLQSPSLAAIVMLMSMLAGRVTFTLGCGCLDLKTRIEGLSKGWRRSIGGIVALAEQDPKHTKAGPASRQSIEMKLVGDKMWFLTSNGLGGKYREILQSAASTGRSNRARQFRDVYMTSESEHRNKGPGKAPDPVTIEETRGDNGTPSGLAISWNGILKRDNRPF